MKTTNEGKQLDEFVSSDTISKTMDPVTTGSHNRPADKAEKGSSGETYATSTKSEVLSALMQMGAALGKEELTNVFNQVASALGGSAARPADKTSGEVGQNHLSPSDARVGGVGDAGPFKANIKGVPTGKGEIGQIRLSPTSVMAVAKEDVEEMFSGDELSEEIKEKATIVFEAAINTRLVTEVARLEEEFETRLLEEVEEIRTELVENVDKYLSYAVEEWISENAVSIDSTLKNEIAEDFIFGLKSLFEENYIELPESRTDVVKNMLEHIEELEAKLTATIDENIDLRNSVEEQSVVEAFDTVAEGLTVLQAEKLRVLSENIGYDSVDDFHRKVSILKESYFNKKPSNVLSEEEDFLVEETVNSASPMNNYVKAISNQVKK
jgi:hypothetical protein